MNHYTVDNDKLLKQTDGGRFFNCCFFFFFPSNGAGSCFSFTFFFSCFVLFFSPVCFVREAVWRRTPRIYRTIQTMILFLLLMATRCVGFLVTPVIILYIYYIAETRVFVYVNPTGLFLRGRCSSVMTGPDRDFFFYFLFASSIFLYLIVHFRHTLPRQSTSSVHAIIRLNYRRPTRRVIIYCVCNNNNNMYVVEVLITHITKYKSWLTASVFTFILIRYVSNSNLCGHLQSYEYYYYPLIYTKCV